MLLVQTKVYSTPEVMPKICQVPQVYAKMLKYCIEKGKELRGRSFSSLARRIAAWLELQIGIRETFFKSSPVYSMFSQKYRYVIREFLCLH